MDQTNFDQTTTSNAFEPAIVNVANNANQQNSDSYTPIRPESIEAAGLRLLDLFPKSSFRLNSQLLH